MDVSQDHISGRIRKQIEGEVVPHTLKIMEMSQVVPCN